MKKIITILAFIAITLTSYSQTYHYYKLTFNGGKSYPGGYGTLTIKKDSIYFYTPFKTMSVYGVNSIKRDKDETSYNCTLKSSNGYIDNAIIRMSNSSSNYRISINSLKSKSEIILFINPFKTSEL